MPVRARFCLFYAFAAGVALLLVNSCATPTQPTGGPADQTPPMIIETEPANGSVNFEGDELRFRFDKYVDRDSFERAFRIDPIAGIRYDLNWRGRSVRVQFEEALPDSTTLIFTIGTDFSDTNRNRLSQPFVLALSTGPVIDEGEIQARILDGETGRGKPDAFVFLYREPVDLETPASYVAQSDTSGQVNFSYLSEGRYKAFYVDDRNQNRRWEPDREVARPFYTEFIDVEQGQKADLGRMYLNEPDTLRPRLEGIGMFSSQRLRLRFNRDMQLGPEAAVSVLDSLGGTFTEAVPLYTDPAEKSIVFAQAGAQLDEEARYRLEMQGITDRHGNTPRSSDRDFSGSAQPDTTQTRLIRHLTEDGVPQSEPFIFEFSTLLEGTAVVDSLEVIEDEIIYEAWEPLEIQDNLLYIFPPPPGKWREGSDYTIRLYDAASGSYQNIETTFFPDSQAGSVRISLSEEQEELFSTEADTAAVEHHITMLKHGEVVFETRLKPGETALAGGLRPGKYLLQAYRDEDGSGSWFRGTVDPWKAPEPYHIEREIEVFSRMEGDYALEYQLGSTR